MLIVRRTLAAEPRHLAASAAGIGLAVALVLLLDGMWAGIRSQVTLYEDHTGAQLYVVAPARPSSTRLAADELGVGIGATVRILGGAVLGGRALLGRDEHRQEHGVHLGNTRSPGLSEAGMSMVALAVRGLTKTFGEGDLAVRR